jgi:hypothetical protein
MAVRNDTEWACWQRAHGGHSGPGFDLIVGFAVLALTWIATSGKKNAKKRASGLQSGLAQFV